MIPEEELSKQVHLDSADSIERFRRYSLAKRILDYGNDHHVYSDWTTFEYSIFETIEDKINIYGEDALFSERQAEIFEEIIQKYDIF